MVPNSIRTSIVQVERCALFTLYDYDHCSDSQRELVNKAFVYLSFSFCLKQCHWQTKSNDNSQAPEQSQCSIWQAPLECKFEGASVRFGGIRRWVALFVCVGFRVVGFRYMCQTFNSHLFCFVANLPIAWLQWRQSINLARMRHATKATGDRVLANELAIFLLIYPTNRIL